VPSSEAEKRTWPCFANSTAEMDDECSEKVMKQNPEVAVYTV